MNKRLSRTFFLYFEFEADTSKINKKNRVNDLRATR